MALPHSTINKASRRRGQATSLRTRSRLGTFESLEHRRLLAADVITIQNPNNGVQIEFAALDFTPGSILTRDIIPLFQGAVTEVDTVFQAKLGSLLDSSNNVVLETGGLNSTYEITVVVQVTVERIVERAQFRQGAANLAVLGHKLALHRHDALPRLDRALCIEQ